MFQVLYTTESAGLTTIQIQFQLLNHKSSYLTNSLNQPMELRIIRKVVSSPYSDRFNGYHLEFIQMYLHVDIAITW